MGIQNFGELIKKTWLLSDMGDFKGRNKKTNGEHEKFHHWEELGKMATKTKNMNDVSQRANNRGRVTEMTQMGKIENWFKTCDQWVT